MATCPGIKFKYKMGPIPSGLSTTVTLELTAEGGVLREGASSECSIVEILRDLYYKIKPRTPLKDGLFDLVHTLVLTSQNGAQVELPVIARIMPKSEIERRKHLGESTIQLGKNVRKVKSV